jgi:hypothetical protein
LRKRASATSEAKSDKENEDQASTRTSLSLRHIEVTPSRADAPASVELASLERENVQLRAHLRTDVDAARELERSVIQVGALQRTFANKVAEQADELAHIQSTLAGATDAVVRGYALTNDVFIDRSLVRIAATSSWCRLLNALLTSACLCCCSY